MTIATMGPDIRKSALIIVDMQNDFVHPDGGFACIARENPAAGIMCSASPVPSAKRAVR